LITYGNDACPHYVGVWGKGGKDKKINKNSSQ
jgi:hypothetical protein